MDEKRWEKWYNQYLEESISKKRKMSYTQYKNSMKKGYEKYKAIAESRRYGKKASYNLEEYVSERNRYYMVDMPGEKNIPRRIAMEDSYFTVKQKKTFDDALRTLKKTINGIEKDKKLSIEEKKLMTQDILESVRKGAGISEALWNDIYYNKNYGSTEAHETAAWMLFRYLIGDEYEDYMYEGEDEDA